MECFTAKSDLVNLPEKHDVKFHKSTKRYKHTHTGYVESFNKELGETLLSFIDFQDLQYPEEVSAIKM